jgi:signal transduction histidine kinase
LLRLETGWIYLRDPQRNLFHLASWYGVPPEMEAQLLHQGREASCRCQRHLVEDLLPSQAHMCPCARLDSAGHSAQSRHVTIPIEARGQKYGVINILYPPHRTVPSEDLDMLSSIGAQVSEIVANAWLRLKLSEEEAARQMLLESLVEAQEEERGRLARELHDGAGQMLTTLLVRIKTLERQCDSPELQSGLQALMELVSDTVEQVRELSYGLRPAALEEFGLPVALHILVEEMTQDAPLQATYYSNLPEDALPTATEVTLYRIAQEALTNVLRHAGAENVQVTLLGDGNVVRMSIVDDGCGFDVHQISGANGQRHLGLISIRERAAMARGALTVESTPGEGTSLLVRIPLLERFPA